jgi:hypothetical protein
VDLLTSKPGCWIFVARAKKIAAMLGITSHTAPHSVPPDGIR